MKSHGSPWLATILGFGLLVMPRTATSASPLMCQARASSPTFPPYETFFQALAAAGVTPYGFHWDFGDGASSDEPNPIHTYDSGGVYDAILTVTDFEGTGVCRDTVVVYAGVIVDPFCGASASTRWGEAPLEVGLRAYPALVGDPKPYTWSWWFGDGGTSASQHPIHEYAAVGTYWAIATMTTPVGRYRCFPSLRISAIPGVTGVGPSERGPDLRLEPARPNPFRVMTAIEFELPRPGRVRLEIMDLGGRRVATLVEDHHSAGRHFGIWQGRAASGQDAPAGMYFARLDYEGMARSIRLVRVR